LKILIHCEVYWVNWINKAMYQSMSSKIDFNMLLDPNEHYDSDFDNDDPPAWDLLPNDYKTSSSLFPAQSKYATEAEIKKWKKYIFLDEKTNVIRLTDEGNRLELVRNGILTDPRDLEPMKVIIALVKQQAEIAEVAENRHSILRYEPSGLNAKLYAPYEVPILLDQECWLPYEKALHDKESFNMEQQVSHWTDHVFIDSLTRKVRLQPLGEQVLMGKIKVSPLMEKVFREIIAFLLMKISGQISFGGKSRMEPLVLPPPVTSVVQLSVELMPPQINNIQMRSIYCPATVRFLPLFTLKKEADKKEEKKDPFGLD